MKRRKGVKTRIRSRKNKYLTQRQIKKQLKILLVLFVIVYGLAWGTAFWHYKTFPGTPETETVHTNDKGIDFLDLAWDETRNTEEYHIFYRVRDKKTDESGELVIDDSWSELTTSENNIRVSGLEEGVTYSFVLRPDNEKHEGVYSSIRRFRTLKRQNIKIDEEIVKIAASEPFKLDVKAKTELTFKSDNTDVVTVDKKTGLVTVKGPGRATIKVKAKETDEFTKDTETVEIQVLDAYPQNISGASVRYFYHLDSENCDAIIRVEGAGGATTPQGMAFTGERYMVTFGMYGPTRIVGYNLKGIDRTVEVPGVSLGHPNGFTYSPDSGRCWCVSGRSSRCVVYNTNDGSYRAFNLPTGASGISYDPVMKRLCTSARKSIIAYDPDSFKTIKRWGVVGHSGTVYRQDCVCYNGLMLHILSGANKHGTNYIDVYDIDEGLYIGTITLDLSEVESAIVDNDGYLEILSNGSGNADYIWKSDLNIKKLAEGLKE